MNFQHRVSSLVQLGSFFTEVLAQKDLEIFEKAYQYNKWFTPENTRLALSAWASELTETNIKKWLAPYKISEINAHPKTVAIIMAGNIPLVGLHDLMSVLVTGNKTLVKLSGDDTVLMSWVINQLLIINPQLTDFINISETRLPQDFDAVIATGSNNTNRYFEYYFRNKPSLLRANRNSIAILTGKETPEDFAKLGADIFNYFGLGCRNVSKLYVPIGYDFISFYEGIEPFFEVINHHKYANNYTYHKAIFLMNLAPHLDNNFLLVKEDESIASPLGVMFYSTYSDLDELQILLAHKKENVQCIVSKIDIKGALPLGNSQQPHLWDYADGVDTVEFLVTL